ncbi:MAG: hypothetical protein LBI63_05485 [Candidatus Ancillula sp.]|jgi:ABC-type transport system substrate-binding protein|nr:hypothetical protein [Candidatus Ancillula sp.]
MIKVGVDDLFESYYPFNADNFSARTIISSIYDTLLSENQNSLPISPIAYFMWKSENTIKLEFTGRKWSNGEEICANHLEQTFYYILEKNLKCASLLNFITGVKEIKKNAAKKPKLGIKCTKYNMTITTEYPIDAKKILNSILLTPMYFKNNLPTFMISSGKYKIKDIKQDYVMVENNFHYYIQDVTKKILKFFLVGNCNNILKLFENSEIDITPSTFYKRSLLDRFVANNLSTKKIIKDSNIDIFFELKQFDLELKKYIEKRLSSYSGLISETKRCSNYFFKVENKMFNDSIQYDYIPRELNIIFPNYYPNSKIVSAISRKNIDKVISYNFSDYIKYGLKMNYDIALRLTRLFVGDFLDRILTYISFVGETHLESYLALVNSINYNNPSISDINQMNDFLEHYSRIVPFGKVIHYCILSEKAKDFYIDDNDLYQYERL